jgi:TRAP-type mannitol/chloroaromatic compound transport system permease small subunit
MNTYVIGNLLGRLLASYIIIWLCLLLFSSFNWRQAFDRSRKWYGLLLFSCVFLLGLAGGLN